jgi:hypothetical protein
VIIDSILDLLQGERVLQSIEESDVRIYLTASTTIWKEREIIGGDLYGWKSFDTEHDASSVFLCTL